MTACLIQCVTRMWLVVDLSQTTPWLYQWYRLSKQWATHSGDGLILTVHSLGETWDNMYYTLTMENAGQGADCVVWLTDGEYQILHCSGGRVLFSNLCSIKFLLCQDETYSHLRHTYAHIVTNFTQVEIHCCEEHVCMRSDHWCGLVLWTFEN